MAERAMIIGSKQQRTRGEEGTMQRPREVTPESPREPRSAMGSQRGETPAVPHTASDLKVFLSVGHGLSGAQDRFVREIRTIVEDHGALLLTLSRDVELAENPLLS